MFNKIGQASSQCESWRASGGHGHRVSNVHKMRCSNNKALKRFYSTYREIDISKDKSPHAIEQLFKVYPNEFRKHSSTNCKDLSLELTHKLL